MRWIFDWGVNQNKQALRLKLRTFAYAAKEQDLTAPLKARGGRNDFKKSISQLFKSYQPCSVRE